MRPFLADRWDTSHAMTPSSIPIPDSIEWLRAVPAGVAWLDRLPEIVARGAARWGLEIERPYDSLYMSWVAPVTVPDGSRAVLKIQFPDHESEHEAEALRVWDGNGAIHLIDHDPEDFGAVHRTLRAG